LGGFVEVIERNALTRTLRENEDVLHLRDHDSSKLLGRTTAGTTTLAVDGNGLHFETVLPDTEIGSDTYENVRLRNLTGNSFGMVVTKDDWKQLADGTLLRTVLDLDLLEISTTSFPAYQATSVDARAIRSQMQMQTAKRDAGDASGIDPAGDDCSCDIDDPNFDADCNCNDSDRSFTPCSECRSALCQRCSANFRSKRAGVGLDGLPQKLGLCSTCRSGLCDRCFRAYYNAVNEDDADARSHRRALAAQLLLRAANS
jgi:HK97 family phage prohead protease